MMIGYCVKCRAKRTMKNSKSVIMKNGRPAQKGICDTCNTIMFKIGKYQMLKLKQFNCKCQKCYCLNPVFDQNKICAECIYGIHEGAKN